MPPAAGPEGLVPISWAIGGMLGLALVVAAGLIAVLFAVGQFQGFQKEPLTAAALCDLLKIGVRVRGRDRRGGGAGDGLPAAAGGRFRP
jgi:hypothetical protein